MNATGIVRRIDDLGRVVIPKEIRRVLHIRDGDPLEIYTAIDGGVVFKKYSPLGELGGLASDYAEVLATEWTGGVAICDRDRVVAAAGAQKKEVLDKPLTAELERITEDRKTYYRGPGESERIAPFRACERIAAVISPILTAGDVAGAVVFLMGENDRFPSAVDVKLCRTTAALIGKQLEE